MSSALAVTMAMGAVAFLACSVVAARSAPLSFYNLNCAMPAIVPVIASVPNGFIGARSFVMFASVPISDGATTVALLGAVVVALSLMRRKMR